jgi:hypothetical protein
MLHARWRAAVPWMLIERRSLHPRRMVAGDGLNRRDDCRVQFCQRARRSHCGHINAGAVQFRRRTNEPLNFWPGEEASFLRLDMAISDGLRIAALGHYSYRADWDQGCPKSSGTFAHRETHSAARRKPIIARPLSVSR